MSIQAFAVTCERFYPGIVSYYAAYSEDGAINEALFAMRKVGGRARRQDIACMQAPEYDKAAEQRGQPGCIDSLIEQFVTVA